MKGWKVVSVLVAATTILYGGYSALAGPTGASANATTITSAQFPAALSNLPVSPSGLAIVGSHLLVPQFQLGGESTLWVYDVDTETLRKMPVPAQVSSTFAYCVTTDTSGGAWIGTKDALVMFDLATGTFQAHPLPPVRYAATGQAPGPNHEVLGLVADPNGRIWMTRNDARSVTAYDPAADTFEEIMLPYDVVPRGISMLKPGTLALQLWHSNEPSLNVHGNLNVGAAEFSPMTGSFRFHAGAFTTNLAADGNGNMWMAEGAGLRHSNEAAEEVIAAHSFFSQPVVAVSQKEGAVWYTSSPDKLVSRVSGKETHYQITPRDVSQSLLAPPSRQKQTTPTPVFLNPDVNALVIDSHGNAWFSASGFNAIGEIKLGQ
jgi:streptogramin lyase